MPLTLNLDPAQHKEHPLQRFFSTFPRSWPGAGLLLLRTVAGGAAVVQGALYLALGVPSTPASWALALLPIAGGLALIAGFLTPAAGVVAGLATLCIAVTWSPSPVSAFFIDRLPALLVLADAAALTMLGPGAYSLDARLFGRREILVVRRDDPRH